MAAIEYMPHALKRFAEREADRTTVEAVVLQPEQVVEQDNGRFVHQSRILIGQKRYLVRVVIERSGEDYLVVTFYVTSKMRKYWE